MRARHTLTMVPLALGLANMGLRTTGPAETRPAVETTTPRRAARSAGGGPSKDFSIPLANLRDWAKTVVVTMDQVKIEGNSQVHQLEDDCEMHFGAHTPGFQGMPDGLVLEPMNVCVESPPDAFDSWPALAKSLKNKTVTASGVPRIWPEHLQGGTASNPDHAAELHPLTGIVSAGNPGSPFDFSANIFAGEYHGKDGNRNIAQRVSVSVTTEGQTVNISFRGGQIGNFTTVELSIDRASITSDGAGSFRMNADATMDNGATVPVRVVTVKGSPINDAMPAIKSGPGPAHIIESALVLNSLNTEALLDAATRSHGQPVQVTDRPVQFILYGPTDSE